ncbi:MAG: SDR family oxidoreductase [Kiloniellales bacterium]|nr:SDR family oxidoreductase [Kiloniellales bacterium]
MTSAPEALPKILLTGATGALGVHLTPALRRLGACRPLGFRAMPTGGAQVDLTDREATWDLLGREQPDFIVHAAAKADVDDCESDPEAAHRLNVLATRHLVDWARRNRPSLRFLYISTDHVYDAPGASAEDSVQPVNVYALTKLWAEDLALMLERSLVVRTSFFGSGTARRRTFVDWVVESCRGKRPVTLFDDVFFNPLEVGQLCDLIVALIERDARGVYNLGAAGGGLTKGDFIRLLVERFGLPATGLRPGRVEDVALRARRPKDMRMALSKAEALLGRRLPSVAEGLERLTLDGPQSRAS